MCLKHLRIGLFPHEGKILINIVRSTTSREGQNRGGSFVNLLNLTKGEREGQGLTKLQMSTKTVQLLFDLSK